MTNKNTEDQSEQKKQTLRKKRDLAFILPLIGTLFFLTPIIDTLSISDHLTSLNQLILLIFGIWALLIICTFFLAHSLRHEVHED